jgi:hypothetical protein
VSTIGVDRLRGDRNPLRREADVVDRVRRRVVVLDRETGASRLGEQGHRLGDAARIVGIAALAVDVQRQLGSSRQLDNVRNELVAGHLRIKAAERPRESLARRGERVETERREQPCGAAIPRVGHEEELRLGVELCEACAACVDVHAQPPLGLQARVTQDRREEL